MAKVRVSTLAKEFGMTSKELMGHLADMKIPAKSASSALEDAYVAMVRKQLAPVNRGPRPEVEAAKQAEERPLPPRRPRVPPRPSASASLPRRHARRSAASSPRPRLPKRPPVPRPRPRRRPSRSALPVKRKRLPARPSVAPSPPLTPVRFSFAARPDRRAGDRAQGEEGRREQGQGRARRRAR